MVKCVLRKFLVMKEFVHFIDVFPNFSQIEWSKVFKEALVHKILDVSIHTLSMLKKKALGMSLGGD